MSVIFKCFSLEKESSSHKLLSPLSTPMKSKWKSDFRIIYSLWKHIPAKHVSFDKMAFPNEKILIFFTILSFVLVDLFIFNLKSQILL